MYEGFKVAAKFPEPVGGFLDCRRIPGASKKVEGLQQYSRSLWEDIRDTYKALVVM